MMKKLCELKNYTKSLDLVCKPQLFDCTLDTDRLMLEDLLQKNVFVNDEIESQLRELIRSRHPKNTLSAQDYDTLIGEHLGAIPIEQYGVWVYYPWNTQLVHILPEHEFVELRTSRNNYKITDEEERILSGKKIGVVGLSVGQSVSLTLSMERSYGELRIADFDTLELTNLNRIRSGVHNLGLHKTIMVAREIAEIDPYLKVVPFTEGLTKENMDRFFTEGGQLDLVIDECDGLDMKIFLRQKAKSLQIPVVMEASDRGTLDVERYDLEPERPLLHGYIAHLDASKIGSLTNEEKLPFILPMLGIETISKRLKASMAEIGQTIVTWPQLASAVALGGAIAADVTRRVLLDQFRDSGRYFVDVEELVGGEKTSLKEGTYNAALMHAPEPEQQLMEAQIGALGYPASAISQNVLTELITAAALAPSAGNNQPWRWISRDGNLYLFHDRSKSVSWSDEAGFLPHIALGAALENLSVKAAALGMEADAALFPAGKDQDFIAAIRLNKNDVPPAASAVVLAEQIPVRMTNRKNGEPVAIDPAILSQISSLALPGDVNFSLITDPSSIAKAASIISITEGLRFLFPQSHHEIFERELKWNPEGNAVIHEGLDIRTLEVSAADEVGLKVASDPAVIALLNKWEKGAVFQKSARTQVLSAGALGLITVPSFDPEQFVKGGQALEQLWLSCTRYNLALHPHSAPIFLHTKIKHSKDHGMSNAPVAMINEQYAALSTLFPELSSRQGVFLFRLSVAGAATARSLRQPISKIYTAL